MIMIPNPKEPWGLIFPLILFITLLMMTGCTTTKTLLVPTRVALDCHEDTIAVDPIQVGYVEFNWVQIRDNVYITLTGKGYETLAKTTRSTISHIKQKNQKIKFLQGCIDEHNRLSIEGIKSEE